MKIKAAPCKPRNAGDHQKTTSSEGKQETDGPSQPQKEPTLQTSWSTPASGLGDNTFLEVFLLNQKKKMQQPNDKT